MQSRASFSRRRKSKNYIYFCENPPLMKTFISDISKKDFPLSDRVSAKSVRHSVLKLIQKDHPDFNHQNYLSLSELNYYREKYVTEYLVKDIEELSDLEKSLLTTSLTTNTTLTDKIDGEDQHELSFGQHIADKVATFGGSWTFIISFLVFITLWIATNVFWLINKGFDPYPFILLNLILSCIAAFQAPVIMMSQNRQEEKDRERAKKDYMINLKSELEIRILHEKIDHFIMDQHHELLESQITQMDMMNDIMERLGKK
jgi:uncharacterized membrane protein